MSYTASHARAAAWVLVATLLFGWVVAGCDSISPDSCAQMCFRTGVKELLQAGCHPAVCTCNPPFADAGTR